MKRIQEKVKDIVDVRPYENIVDFTLDPLKTFSSYYFTDATAELMAKWIDAIAALRGGSGSALALAGYRGVGKSHFLATLGAIISMPELRLRVSDAHVAASAQRLMRRHYPLAYVRRGTAETLLDEFREAVLPILGPEMAGAAENVRDLLEAAAGRGGELPFVLMIDTAFERGSRVARDDGPFLAEIAEAARELNIFVGVVLDDDIAGADGVNSAISRAFAIDYLDPEHLYKVVNSFVFPKNVQMQGTLHDIYDYFRSTVPGFRWSEQRFSALYPLHPAILEVAPFVRLYVHDFALLGFASTAAERIMGRPANSLIGLDEVFDKSERALRKIEELKEGFAAYDKLNSDVVSTVPVMQRLQAKLVLKALLLLSLDGQGTSAAEIAGSMLIFDENEPERAVENIERWIKAFAAALPGDIRIDADEGRGERYAFRLTSRDDLNKALAGRASDVPLTVVPTTLHRFFRDRFSDSAFSVDSPDNRRDWMECRIRWRGTFRPGRLFWSDEAFGGDPAPQVDTFTDWEVLIDLNNSETAPVGLPSGVSHVRWKPSQLRPDEIDVIRRYHVLSSDATFRESTGDEKRASLHSHAVTVEQIVNRVLLEDGKLVIDGFDYNFTEEARSAKNLSDLFSVMLEPIFETRFPEHPFFTQTLGMDEVGLLVSDLYSGTRQRLADVQERAKTFALPLGLVRLENGFYLPEQNDALAMVPAVAVVNRLVEAAGDQPVYLDSIYAELHKEPFGFTREVQHLLLTSLVAQRQIDFITSAGDRINRRSLDLQIIWDDITAVANAVGATHSAAKILPWAAIFAENKGIHSLDGESERQDVMAGLRIWLEEWRTSRIVQRFDELADDAINTGIWKLATDSARILGPVAETIEGALAGSVSLEECLTRIADTFADSKEQFERAKSQLAVVDSFITGSQTRSDILSYLSVCSYTDDDEIEDTREQLYQVIDRSFTTPSDASNREMGYLWIKFQRDYADFFLRQHDSFIASAGLRQRLGEIEQTEQWWKFENLSPLPVFDQKWWNEARHIRGRMVQVNCKADLQEVLKDRPFCGCVFELSNTAELKNLPSALEEVVAAGLHGYATTLRARKDEFAGLIDKAHNNGASKSDASSLAKRLRADDDLSTLSQQDIFVLQSALAG